MTWFTDTEYVSQMTTDVFRLSRWQSYHTFLFYKLSPDVNKSNITGAKWSRSYFPLRNNWVRIQFLMWFLLLNLQFSAAKSLIRSVMFSYYWMSFSSFCFGHWIVCTSIFGFLIPFDIFKLFLMLHFYITHWNILQWTNWGRSGRDRMVVGFMCISPLTLLVRISLRRGVIYATSCDKVCQWHTAGRWFSQSTSLSSINKTDSHDIAEILSRWRSIP